MQWVCRFCTEEQIDAFTNSALWAKENDKLACMSWLCILSVQSAHCWWAKPCWDSEMYFPLLRYCTGGTPEYCTDDGLLPAGQYMLSTIYMTIYMLSRRLLHNIASQHITLHWPPDLICNTSASKIFSTRCILRVQFVSRRFHILRFSAHPPPHTQLTNRRNAKLVAGWWDPLIRDLSGPLSRSSLKAYLREARCPDLKMCEVWDGSLMMTLKRSHHLRLRSVILEWNRLVLFSCPY